MTFSKNINEINVKRKRTGNTGEGKGIVLLGIFSGLDPVRCYVKFFHFQ